MAPEKATKQMEDIGKKPSVVKQAKSPELSGVDRYILAKKEVKGAFIQFPDKQNYFNFLWILIFTNMEGLEI